MDKSEPVFTTAMVTTNIDVRTDLDNDQHNNIISQIAPDSSVTKWKRARGQNSNSEMLPTNPYSTRKRKTNEGSNLFVLENNPGARGNNHRWSLK